MANDDIAKLSIRVDSRQVANADTDLDKFTASAGLAEKATDRFGKANKKASRATVTFATSTREASTVTEALNTSLKNVGVTLGTAFAAFQATQLTREIVSISDEWSNLNSQIRQVTETEDELISVRERLFQVTQDTRSGLSNTVGLYAEITRGTQALAISEERVLGVTKTLNNLFVAGGKPISESAGAIRQLSQGLAAGALRGDEFNSVAEGAPRILDALSASLNMSRGELREFAATGGITTEVLVTALEDYSQTAQTLADQTEKTFAQSFQIATNNVTQFIGESEALNDTIGSLGETLETFSENLDASADAAGAALAVLSLGLLPTISKYVVTLAATAKAQLTAGTTATFTANAYGQVTKAAATATVTTNALGIATRFLLGPWGLLISAVGVGAAAFLASKNASEGLTAEINALNEATEESLNIYDRYVNKLSDARNSTLQGLGQEELQAEFDKTSKRVERYEAQLARLEERSVSFARKATLAEKIEVERRALAEISKLLPNAATSYEHLRDAVEGVVEGLEEELKLLHMTADEQELYNALKKAGVKANTVFGKQITATVKQLQKERKELQAIEDIYDAVDEAIADLSKEQEDYARSLQEVIDTADPAAAKIREVKDQLELLNKAFIAGDIDEDQFNRYAKALGDSLLETGEEAGADFATEFSRSADSIADAIQNAIVSGDWSGVGDSIGGALAGSISSIVGNSLTQSIGGVIGSIAGPIGGAVAGAAIGILVSEVGDFLKGDVVDPTEERQRTQGTGSILGDISAKSDSISRSNELIADSTDSIVNINRGMLRALTSLQSNLASVASMTARARGDFSFQGPEVDENLFDPAVDFIEDNFLGLAGSVMLGIGRDFATTAIENFLSGSINILTLGLGDEVGKLLGGRSKRVDEGIRILGGNIQDLVEDGVVQAFATFKSRKNIFDDYDLSNRFQNFGEDINRQFGLAFASIIDTVSAGAAAIGLDEASIQAAIDQFEVETQKISLEGLSAAEQQAEIGAVFSKIFDDLTVAVLPDLVNLQKVGEGLGETLARVGTSVQLTEEASATLGFQLGELMGDFVQLPMDLEGPWSFLTNSVNSSINASAASIDLIAGAAADLVEKTGGVEAFSQAIAEYENNFLSAEENTSNLSRRLGEALGDLPLPETRDGFKELLAAQSSATEAGRENIALILQLQAVADEYYSTLERDQESLFALQIRLAEALGDEEQALLLTRQRELDAATEAERALIEQINAAEDAAEAADALAQAEEDAAQAAEALLDSISSFTDKFASEAEKFGAISNTVTDVLASIGSELPATREELFALFEALNETDPEAAQTLLDAQDELERYYSILDQLSEEATQAAEAQLAATTQIVDEAVASIQAALDLVVSASDSSLSALRASVSEEQALIRDTFNEAKNARQEEARTAIDAIEAEGKARADSIREAETASIQANKLALDAARNGLREVSTEVRGIASALERLTDAAVDQETRRAEALITLQRALMTGDLTGTGAAASVAADINPEAFATAIDFNRQIGITRDVLTRLEKEGLSQESVAERTIARLDAQTASIKQSAAAQIAANSANTDLSITAAEERLEQELTQLENNYNNEIAALEATLEAAQNQLDTLRGIDSGVRDVATALELFEIALQEERQAREAIEQEQLESGDERLSALLDINAGVQDVASALADFRTALINEQAAAEEAANPTVEIPVAEQDSIITPEEPETGPEFDMEAIVSGLSGLNNPDILAGFNSPITLPGFDFSLPNFDFSAFSGINLGALDLGIVPGFARGGEHSGGLRIVGEQGPELEFTGPSRIMNHGDFMEAMDNRQLSNEIAQLRAELQRGLFAVARNTLNTFKQLDRWDGDGIPGTREGEVIVTETA